MLKHEINVLDYATQITKAIPDGVLVTTQANGKVNTMTIGWGLLGIEWKLPIFTVFIREGRFTRTLLDETMEFTVNVPYGRPAAAITAYCGTHSGRSTDKIGDLNLTLVPADVVTPPAIAELPLTLECKVIYRQFQDRSAILPHIRSVFYPDDIGSDFPGRNKDYHIAYYGQIVKAYIIK